MDVLKIDIEGAEHELLEQDPESFARARVVFAEVHGTAERREAWVERLRALGFEIARRAPAEWSETLVGARG